MFSPLHVAALGIKVRFRGSLRDKLHSLVINQSMHSDPYIVRSNKLQATAQGSKKCPLLVASDLRFMRCMGRQAAFALPSRNILAESRYQDAFDGACRGVEMPPGNWTCPSPQHFSTDATLMVLVSIWGGGAPVCCG